MFSSTLFEMHTGSCSICACIVSSELLNSGTGIVDSDTNNENYNTTTTTTNIIIHKHLPGSSKETCYLISKACIIGMLHDSHQLNTVVTWKEERRKEKTLLYFKWFFLKCSKLSHQILELTLSNRYLKLGMWRGYYSCHLLFSYDSS